MSMCRVSIRKFVTLLYLEGILRNKPLFMGIIAYYSTLAIVFLGFHFSTSR